MSQLLSDLTGSEGYLIVIIVKMIPAAPGNAFSCYALRWQPLPLGNAGAVVKISGHSPNCPGHKIIAT